MLMSAAAPILDKAGVTSASTTTAAPILDVVVELEFGPHADDCQEEIGFIIGHADKCQSNDESNLYH